MTDPETTLFPLPATTPAPTVTLTVKRQPGNHDLPLPAYHSAAAAAFDLRAAIPENTTFTLAAKTHAVVPTGFAYAIPQGYEMQVRPRSGLAAKYGISIANTPGTIDADYRGELFVILINHGDTPLPIARGDRIAQALIAPVLQVTFTEADALDDTPRGSNGLGSTGRS